jgi:hypothetical protein
VQVSIFSYLLGKAIGNEWNVHWVSKGMNMDGAFQVGYLLLHLTFHPLSTPTPVTNQECKGVSKYKGQLE